MRWLWVLGVVALIRIEAAGAGVFDVGGKAPTRVVVTMGADVDAGFASRSEMLDYLEGVVAVLTGADVKALRLTGVGPEAKVVEAPGETVALFFVHCYGDGAARHVEIRRDAGGWFYAKDADAPAKSKPTRLDRGRFEALGRGWSRYRGGFGRPEGAKNGVVMDLPYGASAGWFTVDKEFLGERYAGGRTTQVGPAARDLSAEAIRVRWPRRHDPRLAAGVVVWLWPAGEGDIYEPMHAVLDELGLIAVCPRDVPNQRIVSERYQLALDALESVVTRSLVDPRRVYAAGLSGGGQVSTHLWAGMPDVFTGAVPIAAMASYKNVVVGEGKMWQGTFVKPVPSIFREIGRHRCGAVTGSKDFNRAVVGEVSKVWIADGLAVRVFDYEGLGHEMPSAAQFGEALRWVDEPYREERAKEIAAAAAELALVPEGGAPNAQDVERLVNVTRLAPWSEEAWRAAERLGAVK